MAKLSFSPKRLLLVHAHPDDESLFTGHIIASALAAKAEVMVFTLTRGERGKVKLEELKPLESDLIAMGAFRANELRKALAAFGDVKHKFAGTRAYLDSGMRLTAFGKPAKPKNLDEMSLSAVSTAVISEDILAAMNEFKPDTVVTYNSNGGYGHPDHKKAHEATAMALRKYAKSHRGRAPKFFVIAEPGQRADVQIGDAKTAVIKKAALEAHSSQVATFAETYSIVPGRELRYDAKERLRRASSTPLLWVKPILHALWALPLGVLLGVAGTMLHAVDGGQTGLPIGLIVALTMTASLAIGLRLLRNSRGALYLMFLALSGTILFLCQPQPDGEIFILNNQVGNIWANGSIGITAIVILFPRLHPGSWRKNASGHR